MVLAVLGCMTVLACEPGDPRADGGRDPLVAQQPPERLRVQVLETLRHDRNAFTQGLEIARGTLYEGTGLEGQSYVRAIDLTTGKERRRILLPSSMFGEGITITDTDLWQLTWKDGVAFRRDPRTLEERERIRYAGEGWGICHQPEAERLVMSDGSDVLTFRDPTTFETIGRVRVRSGSGPVDELNELECVDDVVYANVWQTDTILRIDPDEGVVTGEIDASGLLQPDERDEADVLNGIAAIPGTDAFFITGKLWPKTFRVRFVPDN